MGRKKQRKRRKNEMREKMRRGDEKAAHRRGQQLTERRNRSATSPMTETRQEWQRMRSLRKKS